MEYYNPVKENDFIYSVDNIRINFDLDKNQTHGIEHLIMNTVYISSYPENHTMGHYKYLFTFKYDTKSTMTMGISLNGKSADVRTDSLKGYLDFNPNKVANNPLFRPDYDYIKSCCKRFQIARIDLAVDMPYKRENVIIEKDKRKYQLVRYSLSDTTEYLGKRSSVGFVKLYNKTIESELEYDCTRLELTIEPSLQSYINNRPNIYNIGINSQYGMPYEALNDTEKYILSSEWKLIINGLDGGLSCFKSLGRKMKEKLMTFLLPDETKINISNKAVTALIEKCREEF